jgi:predicted DNA-binding protein
VREAIEEYIRRLEEAAPAERVVEDLEIHMKARGVNYNLPISVKNMD